MSNNNNNKDSPNLGSTTGSTSNNNKNNNNQSSYREIPTTRSEGENSFASTRNTNASSGNYHKSPLTGASSASQQQQMAHLSPEERQKLQAQFANFSFVAGAVGHFPAPPPVPNQNQQKDESERSLSYEHHQGKEKNVFLGRHASPDFGATTTTTNTTKSKTTKNKNQNQNGNDDNDNNDEGMMPKIPQHSSSSIPTNSVMSSSPPNSGPFHFGSLGRTPHDDQQKQQNENASLTTPPGDQNLNRLTSGRVIDSKNRHHSSKQFHHYYDNASFSRSHLQRNQSISLRAKSSPSQSPHHLPNATFALSSSLKPKSPDLHSHHHKHTSHHHHHNKNEENNKNFISWNGLYAFHKIDFWKLSQAEYDFEGVGSLSRRTLTNKEGQAAPPSSKETKTEKKENEQEGQKDQQQENENKDPFSVLFHQGGPAPQPGEGLTTATEFREGETMLVLGHEDSFVANDTVAMFESCPLDESAGGGGIRKLLAAKQSNVSEKSTKDQRTDSSKKSKSEEVANLTRGLHQTINKLEKETKKRFWLFKHTKNHGVEMMTFTHPSDVIAYFLDVIPELASPWGVPIGSTGRAMETFENIEPPRAAQMDPEYYERIQRQQHGMKPYEDEEDQHKNHTNNKLGSNPNLLNTSGSFGRFVDQSTFKENSSLQQQQQDNNKNQKAANSANSFLPDGSNPSNATLAGTSTDDPGPSSGPSSSPNYHQQSQNNNQNKVIQNNSLTSNPKTTDTTFQNSSPNNDDGTMNQQQSASSPNLEIHHVPHHPQYRHQDKKNPHHHDEADRSSHSSSTVATTANLGDATYWLDIQTADYDVLLEVLKLFPSIRRETFESFKNASDRHSMRHFSHHGYLACVFTGPTHLQYKEANDYIVLDEENHGGHDLGHEDDGNDDDIVNDGGDPLASRQTRRLNDSKLLQLPRRAKMCCILSKHLCITFHKEPMKGLGSVIKRLHMQFRNNNMFVNGEKLGSDGLSKKQRENLEGMLDDDDEDSSDDEDENENEGGDDQNLKKENKKKNKKKKKLLRQKEEKEKNQDNHDQSNLPMMTPGWVFSMLYQHCIQHILPDVSTLTAVIESMDAKILLQSAEGALETDAKGAAASRNPLIVRVARFRRGLAEHRANLSRKEHLSSLLISPKMSVCSYLNCMGTQQRFHDIIPLIQRSLQQLDSLREILTQCNSNLMSQISISQANSSNKMAAQMTQLSIIATITMPISVLLGAWGMNTPVPFQTSETYDSLTPFFVILGGIFAWTFGVLLVLHLINKYRIGSGNGNNHSNNSTSDVNNWMKKF